MEDRDVLAIIERLVEEEKALRTRDPDGLDEEERRRAHQLDEEIDQCWDYLRQRRAAREYGRDPGAVQLRPPEVVERYLQ